MSKTLKKTLSIIVAILMIVTSVPMAFAAEGETRTIYVKEEITGFNFGYEYWFIDADENGLDCSYEDLGDNWYKYTVPVSAAKYYMWKGIGGGDSFPYEPIPEKVDTLINRNGEAEWYCSHQMNTSGEQTCKGFLCEICGETYGEADLSAHKIKDGICEVCGEAAPDGPLTIDITDKDIVYIGEGYEFYDEDGYILTGTNEETRIRFYQSCNLTLSNLNAGEISFNYAPDDSVINITLDGKTEVEQIRLLKHHLIFDGSEADTFKSECFVTSGHYGSVTVNGGNIVVDRITESNSPTISCRAGFIINGGTVTASNNYFYVVDDNVTLNGGKLNINSTSDNNAAVQGKITINKDALLTINVENEMLRYDSFLGYLGNIVMADDAEENNCLFVRYDTASDFVPAYDICPALDGKTYAEIKIDTHEHSFDVAGKCVCGFNCPHESIVEGKCDDCGVEGEVVTITMTDSGGDSWSGNAIAIEKLIDGVYTEVARATNENGGTVTYNAILDKDGNYVFKWIKGSFSYECSFVINVGGEDVYEVTDAGVLTNDQVIYIICPHKNFVGGKCDICGAECLHESFVEGKCDDCGIDCPHKNFVDDKCSDCGAEGKAVTITMTDSYGDGWNGNAIAIEKLIDGVYTEVARATFEDGDTATYNALLDKDGNYVFKWIQGSYSNECSFVINVGGEDVYEVTSASGLTNGQEFYRICEHKTFTDGKCDCGYECPHAGQTGTCTICGMIIHTHNYEYTASGNTITATCTASSGTCDAPDGAYLKLVVPTKYSWKQYSATAKEIEVENTIADISYEVDYCCDGGCINAGSHTASVTLGGATATVGFEIEKYYVSQASLIMSTRTKVYDGTTDAPCEINALKFYMATGSEIINLPADGYQATVRYETPEVGDRKVIWQWVKVTDQEAMKNHRFGYNDFENGLNSDFSITKRPITVTPEANEVLIGNQPNAGNKVIVGGDYGLADNQTITVTYQHIDSSAVGEKELIIDTVTILDANGNDVTSNYEITTVNGICDVVECPHETYTDGKCDCGYECPHEDITVYGWDYCYTCGYIVAEEIALDTPHTVTERHFVKFTPEVSGRYHFWSYDTTDGADPEGCVYEGSIFNYLDFIGSNNNFLYGNPAYNEITFEAELIAGKTYYFELFEYRKTQNGEPFEYTVMIKKICDNGAHNFTDSICDVCGYECFHPVATEGVCDNCGSACTHNKQNKEITVRPVQNDDGTWEKGTVEITCQVCGNTETKEVERDHEGYKTFDETAAKLEALINSDELIDSPKNGFTASLNNLKNSAYSQVYTEIESAIPSMTDGLNSIIATIEAGLANGTMKKADWTFMTAILDEIKALIDNDPNKIIPSMVGYYYGPNGFYSGSFGNPNYPQADYDRVMTEYGFKNQLETLLAGLKDGTALKADYTEIDEAIAEIEQKLADENVTDEAKAGLEEIKSQLEEMKQNPISSAADLAALEKALEEYETELDAGIEDGSAVKADYTAIDEAIEELDEKLSDVNLTEEAKAGLEEIKAQLEEMKKDPSASKADVDELIGELEEYEEELDKAIEDGSAVEVDGLKEIEDFAEPVEQEIKEKYGEEEYHAILNSMSDEADAERYSIIREARSLTGSLKDNADKLEELKARLQAIFDEVINCLDGVHNGLVYEVTEEAKCEANAIESATCTLCGEEVTREVEGSALKHSFTNYEVTQETTCTNAGIKLAYCDNGCGATDEKEIPALEHIFLDYKSNNDATCDEDGTKTAECVYGCGTTDTVTDEGTKLGHTDEDGDKICDECEEEIVDVCPDCGGPVHEGEYGQYICALRILIKLMVALIQFLATMA